MAVNPMQKRARNSFFLGVFITLIIAIAIGGMAFYFLILPEMKENKKEEDTGLQERVVYVMTNDVKSGEKIALGYNVEMQTLKTGITSGLQDASILEEGTIARINLPAGMILTSDMIKGPQETTDDIRLVEYNMVLLPTEIMVGDYIDIRLTLPTGQDFIVISKKEVITLKEDTIGLHLNEEEILLMSSAIVEAYVMTASKLYALQYVEPGMQEAAVLTYYPTNEVIELLSKDENIVTSASSSLAEMYDIRSNYVNPAVSQYETERKQNIETGIQEQIENAKEARKNYLTGVTSY